MIRDVIKSLGQAAEALLVVVEGVLLGFAH
jgi:hypothetical protein